MVELLWKYEGEGRYHVDPQSVNSNQVWAMYAACMWSSVCAKVHRECRQLEFFHSDLFVLVLMCK